MSGKDYYQTLGVARTATADEIKKAHRKMARKHHPDLNPGDKKAEDQFKQIQAAYDVLSNEEHRKKYDLYGENWNTPGFNPNAGGFNSGGFNGGTGGFNTGTGGTRGGAGAPFVDVETSGINFDEVINRMFGQGTRPGSRGGGFTEPARRSAAPAEDVEFGLEISLEEAYRGVARRINVTVQDACPDCDGMGQKRDAKGRFDLNGATCPRCKGSGRIPAPRSGQVTIPPGAFDGLRLKLPNEGAADSKGRRGDLYVQLKVMPNPKYERDGQNLSFDVAVPYTIAGLGGEISVETLDGKKRQLLVPPGIQTGQKMRLSGQGMPAINDRPTGDAFARVKITVPKDLSDRERALLTELAGIRNEAVRK